MAGKPRMLRMKKELEMLERDPPPGATAWAMDDNFANLQAQLLGPTDTPYDKGVFKLQIIIPDRYPFEPPKIKFLTPIYHPNIDNGGRICLDTLKMPPKGAWTPSLNISTVLTTILLLMQAPNADDGLMADITEEYKQDRETFLRKARSWTQKHAMQDASHVVVEGETKNPASVSEPLEEPPPAKTPLKRKSPSSLADSGAKQSPVKTPSQTSTSVDKKTEASPRKPTPKKAKRSKLKLRR